MNNEWMIWCVVSSVLLLGLAWLGIDLPNWVIYVVDPPAWVSNITGLTRWAGGVFSAMEFGIAYLPDLIGLPIVGSLALWLVYGMDLSGRRGVLGWSLGLCGCIALQFTIAQAYLRLAERERMAGEIRAEASALAKVFYILEKAGNVKMFHDVPSAFDFFARVGDLQNYPEARTMFPPPPPPVRIRLGQIRITLESDLHPVPVPAFLTRGTTMETYRRDLAEIIHNILPQIDLPFDVSGLEQLGFGDLRLYVGMELMFQLLSAGILMKQYPNDLRGFFQSPAELTVHIHPSADDLKFSCPGLAPSSSKLPNGASLYASYDYRERVLHLAVNDADWRRYNVSMLRATASTGIIPSYESQKDFLTFNSQSWLNPMAHETWHFILYNIRYFRGLPLALEEGIASIGESLAEGIGEAITQNARLFDQFPGLRNPARESLIASRVSRCPPAFQSYWYRLLATQKQRKLIPVDTLLQLDKDSICRLSDVSLVYAEGWALMLQVWFSPGLFERLHAAIGRRSNADGRIDPEDRTLWEYLDSELLLFASDSCTSQTTGGH